MEEWRKEDTKFCFSVLKWLSLKEMAVFRTYTMARKILLKCDPLRILNRFADCGADGVWVVKTDNRIYRTAIGRRMFSSRVRRLWSVLTEEEKCYNPKNKYEMNI